MMALGKEQAQVPEQARIMFWACALVSVGALTLSYVGLSNAWDRVGAPIMGVLYALVALSLRWRPGWVTPLIFAALIPTSVFLLGGVYMAANGPAPNSLYVLACASQFTPLFYVEVHVALNRGANLICWLHYAGLVGVYLFLYGPVLHGAENKVAHTYGVLLAAQPAIIVALYYIRTLKGRLLETMRASQEGKERFLAMLSHEIRSPLQAMLGSIDLLALKASSQPEHRAIERIRNAASQLDTHLRDITEYTRMENPSWRLKPEALDLALLVQDVCETYQAQAQDRQIKLICDLPPCDDLTLMQVWADGARVRQILGNLVSNALKYTPSGSITIKAALDEATGLARLDVIDTGIGVPTEDQTRIFEPYVRLEDARTRSAEGSGLGLAVVKRLADRMGATLSVQSQVGQGSQFSVLLPKQA